MSAKAVFLDKDGTLIEDILYNVDPERIRLSAGALDALRLLQEQGYQLIVVTNQSGVARGYFDEADLKRVEARLRELLASAGILLSGFYYCPHYPDGKVSRYAVACRCRKPAPGMIERAALERDLDRSLSWMVGDSLDDVEAGNRAGCQTILIHHGRSMERAGASVRKPDFVVSDLQDAASLIALKDMESSDGLPNPSVSKCCSGFPGTVPRSAGYQGKCGNPGEQVSSSQTVSER